MNQTPPAAEALAMEMAAGYVTAMKAAGFDAGDFLEVMAQTFLPAAQVVTETYALAAGISARLAFHESLLMGSVLSAGTDVPERDDWADVVLTDECVARLQADCLRAYRRGGDS